MAATVLGLSRQTAQIGIPGLTEPRLVPGIVIPMTPDNPVIGLDAPGERRRHKELRAQARLREDSLILSEIAQVSFSLYSTKEIDDLAVVNIDNVNDYGRKTVRDLQMGPHNDSQVCETCYQDLKNCPGHYGKIVLPRLMHPLCVKTIEMVLSCVCNSCSGLFPTRTDLEASGVLRMRGEKRLQAIKDLTKETRKTCTRYAGRGDVVACSPNPTYLSVTENKERYRLYYTYTEKGTSFPLPPDVPPNSPPDAKSIYKILNNISVSDAGLMGFSEESHPRNMIIERLLVPPYCARPDLSYADRFQPDDFTFIYKAIVSKTIEYNDSLNNEAAMDAALTNLYWVISHLMKNDGKYAQGGRRILTDVKKRIQGKPGIVRQNIMGKRVNFAGRTVIGPGHHLRVDQIGIRRLMAVKLTRPIRVTELNRAELQAKYDGKSVKYITMQSGSSAGVRRTITESFEREFPYYRLQFGDVVERILQDGDIVLFNRQPTLHKQNIMAAHAVIHDDRIIKLNLSHTSPMNGDFDGDEMNVHVIQTVEAYAESEQLLHVARNLMAPQRNAPMMGIVYDALSGAYVMTLPQHMLDTLPGKIAEANKEGATFPDKLAALEKELAKFGPETKEYKGISQKIEKLKSQAKTLDQSAIRMQQWMESFQRQVELDPIIYNYAISRVMSAPQFDSLYERLIKYGVSPYTGRGLISATFPEDFDYDANGVLIQEGVLIRGVLDDKIIGRKDGSIIQEMYKQLGGHDTIDFMSDIQFVVNAFMEQHGLSVGIDDCVPLDPAFRTKVDSIMMDARMKVLALSGKTQSKILEEQRERKIVSILEKAKAATEQLVQEYYTPENAIMIMSLSGAKGSMLNAIQMAAVLGLQKVSSQRIVAGLPGNRSLPIFRLDDPDPRARGMCYNSFYTGLDPDEFFFHSQGGREGLTDTAINTAQTGFLQHQIIKSAEDIHIGPDGSVRAIDDTLVQPVYGDDSMEASELGVVKIAGESIPFFRNIQQLAAKINREYGAQ